MTWFHHSIGCRSGLGAYTLWIAPFHDRRSAGPSARSLASLFVLLLASVTFGASPGGMEKTYARCLEATVGLVIGDNLVGWGWFASSDGLVVTSAQFFHHGDDRRIRLIADDDSEIGATLVVIDRGHDLAVLRVENHRKTVRYLPLARPRPTAGEKIFLFSAPYPPRKMLLVGYVTAPCTAFEYYYTPIGYVEATRIASFMQPNWSGGPWLNAAGEVVGVQSAVIAENGITVGLAFMIPGEFVRTLLGTLRNASTPTLGAKLEKLSQQGRAVFGKLPSGTRGLFVADVQENKPAAEAGIKTGDVITSIDGKEVMQVQDLLEQVRAHKLGDKVMLEVLTPGEANSVQREVILGCEEAGFARTPAKL